MKKKGKEVERKIRKAIIGALLATATLTAGNKAAAQDAGRWTLYTSYHDITEIEPAGRNVFVLASENVYSYNADEGSITTYDKTSTLSDAGITHIAWASQARRLVITYENSNVDLLAADGTTLNVPDLYLYETTQDKTINSIYTYNQYAYIATGFGVVKLNTQEGTMEESYRLGFAVDYCYIDGNRIYAASRTDGTYSAAMDGNLLDPASWTRTGGYTERNVDRTNVYDSSTGYWWTTTDDGRLTYYTVDAGGNRTYMTEGVAPDGPASNNFYRLYMHGGTLYGVGGLWSQDSDGHRPGEVHVWDGDTWTEFEQPSQQTLGHDYVDLLCMDFDPTQEGHVMVGAKSGMYEFQDGKFMNHYNYDNSELTSADESPNANYTIVTSLKYEDNGDLWVLNSHCVNSIKKLAADGTWTVYEHPEFNTTTAFDLEKLFISPTNGMMWFVNNYYSNSMLYSYDYTENTLGSYGPRFTNQNGSSLRPMYIYCTAEDRNGNIWIGTDVGPLYLTAEAIRSGSTVFTQYVVPRNDGTNLGDYLLENINIRSMAVDGGNRKWFGTDGNGVFLISDDNNTQVQHFTTDNSPLLSNTIHDIAVDGSTGRVYFATDRGLCSYLSDATEPSTEMTKDNVYAYPNPVRPDYTGPITVVGLTYDAEVKITTSNGTLVAEGRSTGGTFTWDGCDSEGRRVASGVYMVHTSTSSGDKGTVCKIAIVN